MKANLVFEFFARRIVLDKDILELRPDQSQIYHLKAQSDFFSSKTRMVFYALWVCFVALPYSHFYLS